MNDNLGYMGERKAEMLHGKEKYLLEGSGVAGGVNVDRKTVPCYTSVCVCVCVCVCVYMYTIQSEQKLNLCRESSIAVNLKTKNSIARSAGVLIRIVVADLS